MLLQRVIRHRGGWRKKEGVSKTPVSRITENRCYCCDGGSAGTATGDGDRTALWLNAKDMTPSFIMLTMPPRLVVLWSYTRDNCIKQNKNMIQIITYLSFEIERYFGSIHGFDIIIINTIIQNQTKQCWKYNNILIVFTTVIYRKE